MKLLTQLCIIKIQKKFLKLIAQKRAISGQIPPIIEKAKYLYPCNILVYSITWLNVKRNFLFLNNILKF